MRPYLYTISAAAGALFAASDVALAAATAVPGPVAAVGAPALLVIAGAFFAVHYLRSRRK